MGRVARFVAATTLAFGSLLITNPAQAEEIWWAQVNNEHEIVGITAPDGWQFVWGRAWYGDPDDWSCGADVSVSFLKLINNQTTATIPVTNQTFGDTCNGVNKVLRFTWGIVPLPPVIEPSPQPSPEPSPQPTPEPSPSPQPSPEPQPTPEPTPEPAPEPAPEPEPIPEPAPEPAPEPEPEPEPIPEPEPEPAPEPEPEAEPAPEPASEPAPEPPPVLDPELLDPETMTDAEVEELVSVAEATLETTQPGSEAYQEALAQLMVAAEADDPEVPQELAAIPLLGNAAVALLDAFNSVGNIGSDIAPAVREEAQKVVVSSVIVGQIAATASLAAVGTSYRRIK